MLNSYFLQKEQGMQNFPKVQQETTYQWKTWEKMKEKIYGLNSSAIIVKYRINILYYISTYFFVYFYRENNAPVLNN